MGLRSPPLKTLKTPMPALDQTSLTSNNPTKLALAKFRAEAISNVLELARANI